MGIVNRRNAVLGWAVWKAVKQVGKREAKSAVPGPGDHKGLNKGAIASIIAAVGGALWFWRKKSGETPSNGS